MNNVDWSQIAPNAEVLFTTLATDERRDEIDDAVAALRLPGNLCLDMTWDHPLRQYVLSVHEISFRKPAVATARFGSIDELLQAVKAWSDKACAAPLPAPPQTSDFNQSFAEEA